MPPIGQYAAPTANRLREWRQAYGLSPRELAEQIIRLAWDRDRRVVRVGADSVSRWERGERRPRRHYRQLLCQLFDTTEVELGLREALPIEADTADLVVRAPTAAASRPPCADKGEVRGHPALPASNQHGRPRTSRAAAVDDAGHRPALTQPSDLPTPGTAVSLRRDPAVVLTLWARTARTQQDCPRDLVQAAGALAEAGQWNALDMLSNQPGLGLSPISAFAAGLQGITLTRRGSVVEALARFDAATRTGCLTPDAAALLQLHRAHALRAAGRHDAAGRDYQALAAQQTTYHEQARVGLARIDCSRGAFRAALRVTEPMPAGDHARAAAFVVAAQVNHANGNLIEAGALYRAALDQAAALRSIAIDGEARAGIARTLSWLNPRRGRGQAADAVRFNRLIGNHLELPNAYAALAIAEHGDGALARAEASIETALAAATATGHAAGAVSALIARVFQRLIAADTAGARDAHEDLAAVIDQLDCNHHWLEVSRSWLAESGTQTRFNISTTDDWLTHPRATAKRWRAILNHRRK